ncbi:MAG: phosphate ABC transporter permease PstA [Candidatus Promineofilum sp.]|nr:phosphate ABC transporter permease PstA [Promineifilum sp.]
MIDPAPIRKRVEEDLFLQGEAVNRQVLKRRRMGTIWRGIFFSAAALAILILAVLLLKIIGDANGYVAEESKVPARELVLAYNRDRLLNAPNVALAGEDDAALAAGVAADANGIALLPYAFYQAQAGALKLVAVEGARPSAEAVAAGDYPAARPLLLYTSPDILQSRPQVLAFLIYYLAHIDELVTETGYFPADAERIAAQAAEVAASLELETLPAINPADYEGGITIAGSSTVFPLTQAAADRFTADGFRGVFHLTNTGTTAGLRALCIDKARDLALVNASRPALPSELSACRANRRPLQELLVATDALALVVNPANTFVDDVSLNQLIDLFTTAETWAAVDESWPAAVINRYIPSADSGTLDFFAETIFTETTLHDLPYDALVALYQANVSAGRCRAVEYDQRFYADRLVCDAEERFQAMCRGDNPRGACTLGPRDAASVVQLIQADVVKPTVLRTWGLWESLLNRDEILLAAATEFPAADIYFRRWLTWDFIISPQSSYPEIAGVRTAILGTLWVVGIAVAFSFPLGVGAAIYLEEYASKTSRLNRIIQTNINNLAGVPSIIYGLLGLAVFVRALEIFTSGSFFGLADPSVANGRTVLSAGLTLGLLGLPVIIISSQEAIRAVPSSLRQASYGLGATRWQTVRSHVLPNALGGILTGVILSMSRIIGETAPLVVIGASTYITTDPTGPFSKFTTLPSQIYQWTARPQDTFRDIAATAIIVLLLLLFLLNATAIYLRGRFGRRIG